MFRYFESQNHHHVTPRCLLQHVYCVWYLYLPSLITILEPGEEQKSQLQTALHIIQSLRTDRKTNLEEVSRVTHTRDLARDTVFIYTRIELTPTLPRSATVS